MHYYVPIKYLHIYLYILYSETYSRSEYLINHGRQVQLILVTISFQEVDDDIKTNSTDLLIIASLILMETQKLDNNF